jgi:hypothetical protein
MITFFTTGKPFRGHDGIIQRNALKSWTLLHPDVEVIFFGDEEGAVEVCAEFGLHHEPHVMRYESRMPYVNAMFARAQQIARHDYVCYANCDMILLKDFWQAFQIARSWKNRFLLIGQRWDTGVTEPIDFNRPDWADDLRQFALSKGFQQDVNCIDFFLFPKGLYADMPALIVGYAYWDHWMVWKALSTGSPVLDGSPFIVAIHQDHAYTTTPERNKGSHTDPVAMRNFELSGKGKHLRFLLDSTHRITRWGKIRRTRFRRIFESAPVLAVRQTLVELTFPLRKRLGLRRQTLDKLLRRSAH